ncbi:hypothetical protein [Caenimonas soli]|uniref:hypothetical protein n=1 Tax=Caenimonas soli TaxID=2735555 RepID=UPI0015526677|nr:hypothetical protein [Caenimonas soli]NPC57306.1 hypothetical protein [Caenimonas soli]
MSTRQLCLAWILFLSFSAHASEWCREPELNIFGLSAHLYETKYSARHGWNEWNYGAGLTCHLGGVGRWNDEAEAGAFKNSYRRTSFYAGYGLYYPWTPEISGGIRAVLASGYREVNSSGLRVGIMPAVKVKLNESVTLNLLARPFYRPFFCAHVGIKF